MDTREDLLDLQQITVDAAQTAELAKTDFNFLARLALGAAFIFNFPKYYLVLFSLLIQFKKKFERFAIGLPRGFAKTTFIKILCVYYILFTQKRFILVVGASEKKAVATIADVCGMLSSPNIRRLFGHWDNQVEIDQAVTKIFYFRGKTMILWAAGANTSVRGINRDNDRPDVIIMDDIQDKEDAKNPDLAEDLLVWMLSTLLMARSFFDCTAIFIGNMYPQNSILERLKRDPQWITLIVGGLLDTEDGGVQSLWEELRPVEDLLEEYEDMVSLGHPEIFITEVLNSTDVALASGIDISKIPFLPSYLVEFFNNEEQGEGSFIIIDPSSGKKTGDDCSIMYIEVVDGISIPRRIESGTFDPLKTIETAIELGFETDTRAIFCEDVAYQSTLLFWFQQYCETPELNKRGIITGFVFNPVAPRGQAKNNRIKKGYTQLLSTPERQPQIYLHPDIRSLVIDQYKRWDPLKVNNEDENIDLIGYIDQIRQEYGDDIVRNVFSINSSNASATGTSNLDMPF